jgi:hypothetical protein
LGDLVRCRVSVICTAGLAAVRAGKNADRIAGLFAMITKFDSLYAGHTDLDNIGYGGTPINERRYSNAHLATALSKAESMAKLMDGLGYNCFWLAEHHFQPEGTECRRRFPWSSSIGSRKR